MTNKTEVAPSCDGDGDGSRRHERQKIAPPDQSSNSPTRLDQSAVFATDAIGPYKVVGGFKRKRHTNEQWPDAMGGFEVKKRKRVQIKKPRNENHFENTDPLLHQPPSEQTEQPMHNMFEMYQQQTQLQTEQCTLNPHANTVTLRVKQVLQQVKETEVTLPLDGELLDEYLEKMKQQCTFR